MKLNKKIILFIIIVSVIIGSFVLNDLEDPDFECIDWNLKSINWISINRLAILPQKQGKGYAKKAMAFIENIALLHNKIKVHSCFI